MTLLASQEIIDAFNVQIGHELGASNQYVSIASYFSAENLEELAQFFFRQAEEERAHAMKFVHFILDVGGHVEIPAVPAPQPSFASAARSDSRPRAPAPSSATPWARCCST